MITLCRLFCTLGAAALMTLAAAVPASAAPAGCRTDHLCVWNDYASTSNTLNYATYSTRCYNMGGYFTNAYNNLDRTVYLYEGNDCNSPRAHRVSPGHYYYGTGVKSFRRADI